MCIWFDINREWQVSSDKWEIAQVIPFKQTLTWKLALSSKMFVTDRTKPYTSTHLIFWKNTCQLIPTFTQYKYNYSTTDYDQSEHSLVEYTMRRKETRKNHRPIYSFLLIFGMTKFVSFYKRKIDERLYVTANEWGL